MIAEEELLALDETWPLVYEISQEIFLCAASAGASVMSPKVQEFMYEDSKRLAEND